MSYERDIEQLQARIDDLEKTVAELAIIVFKTDTNSPSFWTRSWAIFGHVAFWFIVGWTVKSIATVLVLRFKYGL